MFDVQAEHPVMFSKISPSMDDMVNEINSGKSALNKYNLGVLNASRTTDVVLLTEIHLVHQMINAVSLMICFLSNVMRLPVKWQGRSPNYAT